MEALTLTPNLINQADLVIKSELVKLQSQLLEFVKAHNIYRFTPAYDTQRAFFESDAHVRLAIGDNRSGKTTCGTVEDVAWALGFRPWMLPEHLKKKHIKELLAIPWEQIPAEARTPRKPPIKLCVVVEDWEKADEIFVTGVGGRTGKLTHYIPKGAIARLERNQMGYVSAIHITNGSVIGFETEKSYKNNPKSFEGAAYDAIHYDEPKDRGLRNALARGLIDTDGYEWFTFTPWNVGPWVYDELVVKAASNPRIEVFQLDAKQNPHISQEAREAYLATLSETERLARGEGKFVHLQGLVYPEFIAKPYDKGGNIVPDKLAAEWIAENGSVYVGMDVHPRQNQTALYLCADNLGRWVIYDVIFVKALIPEFCSMLKQKLYYGKDGAKLVPELWEIDPIAFIEDPIDRRRWADTFHDPSVGIDVIPASKRKEHGIAATRQAFKDRKLLVCGNCTRLIWELQHYVYSEWNNPDTRNEKERPVDKDDHCCEVLYRLVLREPTFVRRGASTGIAVSHCR